MTTVYQLSPIAIKLFKESIKTLDKYKNLEGVKTFLVDIEELINIYSQNQEPGYPPLPPIAEIPTDDLLKEIKRRIEYHPGPIG